MLAGGPAAAQSLPPFAFEDVDFTSDCTPNAAFARLLTVLQPGARAETEAAFDEPLYNAVAGTVTRILRLNSEIEWHGLRLVGVRVLHGVESGPSNHSLVFEDSPERVRAVWSARGWSLPAPGEIRVIEDEAIHTAVGVEADGELSAVTCFVD
jgi:hypothetical protein